MVARQMGLTVGGARSAWPTINRVHYRSRALCANQHGFPSIQGHWALAHFEYKLLTYVIQLQGEKKSDHWDRCTRTRRAIIQDVCTVQHIHRYDGSRSGLAKQE